MPSTAELCTGSTVSHVNNAGLNGKKKSQCLPVARQGGAAHGAAAALGGTGGRGSGTEDVLRPQAGGGSAGGAVYS